MRDGITHSNHFMEQYKELKQKMQKLRDVESIASIVSWDQETYMPDAGTAFRAQQSGTLAGIAQDLLLDPSLLSVVQKVIETAAPESDEYRNASLSLRDITRQKKLSSAFVAEFRTVKGNATGAWQKAKKGDAYEEFAPHLTKVLELSRQQANLIDPSKDPYDVLLDDYEPEMTIEKLDHIFEEVKAKIVPLYKKTQIYEAPSTYVLEQEYETSGQVKLAKEIIQNIGFDFMRGRTDMVEHPFCTTFSPDDIRITTRIKPDDIVFGLWSSIHEAGHGMYEQGLPREQYGLPLGDAVGMGVHESQSRLWENNVCKSREFVEYLFPRMQSIFPSQLTKSDPENFYKALNAVKPWPIRIESDELSYHLHILIRYEIERGLLSGDVSVEDAPHVWRAKYKEYLGIELKTDTEGIFQDVHWSFGLIGYFPTYSLGSLYAAQYHQAARESIANYAQKIQEGNFDPVLSWLRTNVHAHGRRYNSEELCKRATGSGLDVDVFVKYIEHKISDIYEV